MASSRRLRALLTNDDGIDSPGLWALAAAVRRAGLDVTVAAPHVDASGVGASVYAVRDGGRIALHPRELPDLAGVPAFAVEAHPAFIVHAAARGWLDPAPDIVVAGINAGSNVGRAVVHSGTVGAALAASLHGWRGLAVSLDTGWVPPPNAHWATAAGLLPQILDLLLAGEPGHVLSLNVPDRPAAELGELREARLAAFGTVQVRVDQRSGPDGEGLHTRVGELGTAPEPGTDTALLAAGHPTVTSLESVGERAGGLGAGLDARSGCAPSGVSARRGR